jgi:RNA polymerase sigma-70 factor (ECF subfamily)
MGEFTLFSDEQLVVLVQSTEDVAAYSELVKRHQMSLFAFLYRYTDEKYLAEDLTQDTFIKALNKIHLFKQKSTFKTWLFSIAYREFLQAKRKTGIFHNFINKIKQNTSQRYLMKVDDSIDLNHALKQLSDNQKAVLLLCDASGMSNTEAAIALDMPLGSLKTYIKQARSIMQKQLEYNHDK